MCIIPSMQTDPNIPLVFVELRRGLPPLSQESADSPLLGHPRRSLVWVSCKIHPAFSAAGKRSKARHASQLLILTRREYARIASKLNEGVRSYGTKKTDTKGEKRNC